MSKLLTVKHKTVKPFTLDREFIVCDEDCSFSWNYESGWEEHSCYGCCLNRISDNASLAEFRDEFQRTCPNDNEVMTLLDAQDISILQDCLDKIIDAIGVAEYHEDNHVIDLAVDSYKKLAELLNLKVHHD